MMKMSLILCQLSHYKVIYVSILILYLGLLVNIYHVYQLNEKFNAGCLVFDSLAHRPASPDPSSSSSTSSVSKSRIMSDGLISFEDGIKHMPISQGQENIGNEQSGSELDMRNWKRNKRWIVIDGEDDGKRTVQDRHLENKNRSDKRTNRSGSIFSNLYVEFEDQSDPMSHSSIHDEDDSDEYENREKKNNDENVKRKRRQRRRRERERKRVEKENYNMKTRSSSSSPSSPSPLSDPSSQTGHGSAYQSMDDESVPSVEFFPKPQKTVETEGYVWLTSYSRIPVS